MMKALKAGLIVWALLSQNSLKADTWNMGVSATANVGGNGVRNPSQLLGYDPTTNAMRMIQCDANGNLLVSNGQAVTWSSSSGLTLTAINGSAATNYYDKLTAAAVAATPAGTNNIGGVGVTSTVQNKWTIGSIASYSLTGTVNLNLTATAGTNAICKYKITSLGPNAGFYHCTAPNNTWVGPLGYFAVSTTPIVDDFLAPGTCLELSATASAATVTVQVEISVLSAQ